MGLAVFGHLRVLGTNGLHGFGGGMGGVPPMLNWARALPGKASRGTASEGRTVVFAPCRTGQSVVHHGTPLVMHL
jgi:hypothetical protein